MALSIRDLEGIREGMKSLMAEVTGNGVTQWKEVNEGLIVLNREINSGGQGKRGRHFSTTDEKIAWLVENKKLWIDDKHFNFEKVYPLLVEAGLYSPTTIPLDVERSVQKLVAQARNEI